MAACVKVTHNVPVAQLAQRDGCRSHNSPENPPAHWQVKDAIPSSQTPPFQFGEKKTIQSMSSF